MTDAPSTESSSEAERLLAADHAELDGLLLELRAELDGGDAARAYALLDLFWARLAVHIRAEHLHLFPAVLNRSGVASGGDSPTPSPGEVGEAVERLRADHDFFMHELARAVKMMREVLPEPGGARPSRVLREVGRIVRAVEGRLAAHNSSEEGMVYRLPGALLSAPEQAALAERVRRELENLPRRFS